MLLPYITKKKFEKNLNTIVKFLLEKNLYFMLFSVLFSYFNSFFLNKTKLNIL